MSLLREIQSSLMEQGQDIGPILLKLKFLASRLGSSPLADWVKHESEGYPNEAELPDYRIIAIGYKVDTSGPLGSGMRNAPIPSAIVAKEAGDALTNYQVRQSVASIDSLVTASGGGGTLEINASNLIIGLQGKIYPGHSVINVTGSISTAALVEIQYAVRSRVLDLTIKLEKEIPLAAEISIGPVSPKIQESEREKVSQIINQIFQGSYTAISSVGDGNTLTLAATERDSDAFIKSLVEGGIVEVDARELAEIVATEEPESTDEPFGAKARGWIAEKLSRAAGDTWKAGLSVATKVMTDAALKYYGLK